MTSGNSIRSNTRCFLTDGIELSFSAQAQQLTKIPRIGIVSGTGNPNEPGSSIKIFRQALQDLGRSEEKNILFEYRYTEGDIESRDC